MKNTLQNSTTQMWVDALVDGDYEHFCHTLQEAQRLKHLSRVWRRIFRLIDLPSTAHFFEVGIGGGDKAIGLALNGYHVHGIDISPDVVERCHNYIAQVDRFLPISERITIEVGDFFNYNISKQFDVVYHFGVVEHFLESETRQKFWKQMFELTKPGGWVLSVVPCGAHFMRKHIRTYGLSGYVIPEIDYRVETHRMEFEQAGLTYIQVIPHNFLGFYTTFPRYNVFKSIYKLAFYGVNSISPLLSLIPTTTQHLAHALIAVGQRSKL